METNEKKYKSLKVVSSIHKELKRFIADNEDENMIDFVGLSIAKELGHRAHKFLKPNTVNSFTSKNNSTGRTPISGSDKKVNK